ncbi:MAG: isochorismatase family protein [Aquincola sp.]|nr:isochorismatase family protein [Aquincola sp.]|tara:strand:+ start:1107 stop:1922 length:816 start_codon:yes stop_codon:yes gene_type:complete
MRTQLLVIDPQNDFCDIAGAALPVAGAGADLQRLAAFIAHAAGHLNGITVKLESHPSVAIERTTFWQQADDRAVAEFTWLTAEVVRSGHCLPRSRDPQVCARALETLEAMSAKAGGMTVWPVHCVTGTWGHNVYAPLAEQLAQWEFAQQRPVRKVLKGEHPLSEHFGVFEADVPLPGAPATQFNTPLLHAICGEADLVIWAGEASSHCVAASFRQAMRGLAASGRTVRHVLLRDCMSPVPGFEAAADAFFEEARHTGAELLTAAQATALWA